MILHSNQFVCKSVFYLTNSIRSMNTMLNVCFSIERLLAVYFPLKIRYLQSKCHLVFKASIFFSFLMPIYFLKYFDLVRTSELQDLNYSKIFHYYSLLPPPTGNFTCSVEMENLVDLTKYYSVDISLLLVAYVFVSCSILAIAIRLKRNRETNNFMLRFNRNTTTSSSMTTIEYIIEESQFNRPMRSFRRDAMSHISLRVRYRLNMPCSIRNFRNADTKMLISLSLSYIIFNTPFYIISLYCCNLFLRNEEFFLERNLSSKLELYSYLVVAESFQLFNFSLTSVFFLFNGRIFRLNAFRLLRKIFN